MKYIILSLFFLVIGIIIGGTGSFQSPFGLKSLTGSYSSSSSRDSNMTGNLLVTEQRACENFVEVGTGKVFEYSELYRVYKNIATNVEAMKDWVVFDMLINKRCDQIQNDPTEKQLCDLYVQGNQITIKNNLNILPLDKGVMLSLLSNTNQCNNDKDCEFDIWLVQKMRARNGGMPDIKNSRLIEWYLYYKQSPNDYNDAIKKLFLELCLK